MKSGAFNTGRCSHFIPRLGNPHPASAYSDKGQCRSTAPSSSLLCSSIKTRDRWSWGGGCTEDTARGLQQMRKTVGFHFFSLSLCCCLIFHAWNNNRKAYESKSSNVERWLGCVNSAHGAWRLTNIQNASVSTPEGRWESVKLNEWIQMRNFELLFELCHKIWICVTSSVQWHLFILRTYTVKTVWILSVRHFPLRLDQWLSAQLVCQAEMWSVLVKCGGLRQKQDVYESIENLSPVF